MKRMAVLALTGTICGFLVLVASVSMAEETEKGKTEQEQKMTLDQLPAVVKDALVKATNGGTIGEIEKEVKNRKTVYEAEFTTKDGKKMEATVDDTGKVVKVEADEDDDVKSEKKADNTDKK